MENNKWVRHRGGKCPVEAGVLVDVKLRDGEVIERGFTSWFTWAYSDCDSKGRQIMKYRLHKPAEQPVIEPVVVANVQAFNEQAELRECIAKAVDGPIQWRDRIHEIYRTFEALEEERVSLIQRLAEEGFKLIDKANESIADAKLAHADALVEVGKQFYEKPVEDMSDQRVDKWITGDKLEILYVDSSDPYVFGEIVSVKQMKLARGLVYVEDENGTSWNLNIDQVKWHSRPAS